VKIEKWFKYLLLALTMQFLISTSVYACSSFRVVSEDKKVFFVFNFELGGTPGTNVTYYPKGTKFTANAPEGLKPASWHSKYAVVGMGWFNQPMLAGGMNEYGLSGANLNLPNYTKYQQVSEKDNGKIIAAWDVPTYFLTQFKTVAEIKKAVSNVKVAKQLWHVMGASLPIEFHYTFHDPSGASIVLEYINGEAKVYDNQLGVMTNSPNFEWQLVNLNNYINLTAMDAKAHQIADVKLISTGAGSGMLGLPGDYTPVSRFVRTVALTQSAKPSKNHDEGLLMAIRISNAISFPEGPARELMGGKIYMGKTDFQMIADTSKRVLYFKHYDYPNWRSVDLAKLANEKKKTLSFDPSKGTVTPDVTSEFK